MLLIQIKTININNINMRKHVKQLSTSDVMVALINQQRSRDNIDQLKKYLYNTAGAVFQKIQQAQEMIFLPDFACKDVKEQQLLAYHFQRNHYSTAHIVNYQSLLQGIDFKMKKIIANSSQSFLISNNIINELIMKLVQSCQYTTAQRKPLTNLSTHLKNKYIVISRKMLMIKNMEKTLDMMRFWNETKISTILMIQPDKIHEYERIETIFQSFDHITISLNQKKHLFANYSNLVHLIVQRKNSLIFKIYANILNSIINYTNDEDLKVKLLQYQFLIDKNLLNNIPQTKLYTKKEPLYNQQPFTKMIEVNIQQMHMIVLKKNKININLQQLREDAFVGFYDSLILEFSHYFTNWHKVTTFHIQTQSKFKQYFIKYRTLVFQKMLQKIQVSLKYSNKLSTLGMYGQKKLFTYIRNFIEFGEQWMGKCKTGIIKLIQQKKKQQIVDFFKLKNGDIKRSILQQFKSILSQQKQSEDNKYQQSQFYRAMNSIRDQIHKSFQQTVKYREQFLDDGKGQSNQQNSTFNKAQENYQTLKRCNLDHDIRKFYQKLNSKFGCQFFKIIIQYQLRQQQLTNDSQLAIVYQHFEYIFILIYKMYVPYYMKKQIENDTFNQLHRTNKISFIRNCLAKGTIDEETIASINELRHIFLDRNNYGCLYDFIATCGNRYQSVSGTSYLNPNVYFQESDKYQTELSQFSQIFLTVMSQLYLLVQYVQYLIIQNRFCKFKQDVSQKIGVLKDIIQSLVLIYFTSYFQITLKKYYNQVVPIFQNAKFQVKKKNQIMINLRQYRLKMIELYQRFNVQRYTKNNCFYPMIISKQIEYFYKFGIDLFSKIQKINDDGRQILKQQPIEINKIVNIDKVSSNVESWPQLMEYYIQISKQRNEKIILQAAEKMVLKFPVQWWRSNLIWFYNDCSNKQKKQFTIKLIHIYLNKIMSLPRI